MEHERSRVDRQINEEACEWFIECRAGDLGRAARRDFDRWLRKSPQHLRAYLEIAAIWNEGSSLDPQYKYDVDTLLDQAAEERANVVALPDISPLPRQSSGLGVAREPHSPRGAPPMSARLARATARSVYPRGIRLGIVAASAILALATGAALWYDAARTPTYATAIGEQRSLVLADGSTVALNSRSKIRVHYTAGERDVELLDGQALFHVAKDPARPFIVKSGETQVRAVGTEFDVYKKDEGTVVTVVEGRVAVLAEEPNAGLDVSPTSQSSAAASGGGPSLPFPAIPGGHSNNIFVSAGEQLSVTHQAIKKADHANVATATAWTQRQLVFDSASLSEVVRDFNRYNRRQLVIENTDLDTFHISGVFSSTDPASLIRFLQTRPGLRVVETSSEIRIEKDAR